jgi:hypothetical protein
MRFFHLLFFISIFSFLIYAPRVSDAAAMIDFPIVKLQALDKSTARTVTFEAKVGTTIEYGSLYIKTQACRKSEPLAKPESAAFLQIWEVPINATKSEWIFSGWMFASSPALSAMDHAVYDVWVLDCLDNRKQNKEAQESESDQETADQAALDAPDEEEPAADTPPDEVEEETDSEAEQLIAE